MNEKIEFAVNEAVEFLNGDKWVNAIITDRKVATGDENTTTTFNYLVKFGNESESGFTNEIWVFSDAALRKKREKEEMETQKEVTTNGDPAIQMDVEEEEENNKSGIAEKSEENEEENKQHEEKEKGEQEEKSRVVEGEEDEEEEEDEQEETSRKKRKGMPRKPGRHTTSSETCPSCLKGSAYYNCTHEGCPFHYHTARMLERHELDVQHHCPESCELCKQIKSHQKINYNKREKQYPKGSKKQHSHMISTAYIPYILKKRLIEDYESITNNGILVPLPRQTSCSKILATYMESVDDETIKNLRLTVDQIKDTINGIEDTFDAALGKMLLYKNERKQYADYVNQSGHNSKPSLIFGVEHLVRLLVRLPDLLDETVIDHNQAEIVLHVAYDLLQYIEKSDKWQTTTI